MAHEYEGNMINEFESGEDRMSELNDLLSAEFSRLLGAALDVIQADPHQWSVRPCQTCRAVSAIAGRPFGCDLYRKQHGR